MILTEIPSQRWKGQAVRITQSSRSPSGTFTYSGTVVEIMTGKSGKQRVLVKPPGNPTFIKPKWLDADKCEVDLCE